MSDLPPEAVQAAVDGVDLEYVERRGLDANVARAALHAAYPILVAEARADERRKVAEQIAAYEDLLGSIWLYIGWRYVTKQLTTSQKEMFADAVEAASRRLNDDDPGEPFDVDRWWRSDAPIRQVGEAW